MKVLFWNMRGCRRLEAVERIRELYKSNSFDILFLAEPKVRPRVDSIIKLGLRYFDSELIHNIEGERTTNLWVVFRVGLVVKKIGCSRQQLTILVGDSLVTTVYAQSVPSMTRCLWQQLEVVKNVQPWLVIGDFNCVLQYSEKKGGRIPCTLAIREFREALDACELVEAISIGANYSWPNNRRGRKNSFSNR